MQQQEDLGPGEIARWLARLEQQMNNIASRLENLPYLRTDLWDTENRSLIERVNSLQGKIDRYEQRISNAYRLAITSFIFPILVGVIIAIANAGLR